MKYGLLSMLCCSVFVVACSPGSTIKDCLEISAAPDTYPEFGECEAVGTLVHDGEYFKVINKQTKAYVFIGDLDYAWSEQLGDYTKHDVTAVGRYQLLEGQFPSLIKINRIVSDTVDREIVPASSSQ